MNQRKRTKSKLNWLKQKPFINFLKGKAIFRFYKKRLLIDFIDAPCSYSENIIWPTNGKFNIYVP